MGAIYGLTLACASVVLFACLTNAKRAVPRARWTNSAILVSAFIFILFVAVIVGVAILANFFVNATSDEFGVLEFIFFCAIVASTVLFWRSVMKPTLPANPDAP